MTNSLSSNAPSAIRTVGLKRCSRFGLGYAVKLLQLSFLLMTCLAATSLMAQVGTFAGIVDTNYSRDCRADGTIDLTGATDMSGIIQTCVNNARANNQQIVELPCTPSTGAILLANTLDLTNRPGLRLRGCSNTLSNGVGSDFGTKITCNVTPCLDTVGSSYIELSNFQLIMFPGATVGILMGRDNATGGGSGPYCFQEFYNLHDLSILAVAQPTANGNLGAIGIANIAAENGIYSNVDLLTDTPALFSATNFVPLHSAQPTFSQCNGATMTGVSIYGSVFSSDRNDRAVMVANITAGFELSGVQFLGGNSFIKFENLSGSSPASHWRVRGQGEGTGGGAGTSGISSSVGIADSAFDLVLAAPVPSFEFIPTANNLGFSGVDFHFDSTAPFINNVQTGTTISGSRIQINTPLNASNTTVNSSIVSAPGLNNGSVSFNGINSEYEFLGSDGTTFFGPVTVNGLLTKSGGSFKIDHPLDPEHKYLLHSFVESPDMMNIYNGVATMDSHGRAIVILPPYFEALNRDFRYQLTCIGGAAQVYIAQEIRNNRFLIAGGKPGLKVSWQVTGIRHDVYANSHRIPVEEEKPVGGSSQGMNH